MVDVDVHNIQILSSQDIDLAQISHVKEVETENNYLKYGLIVSALVIFGFLTYASLERQSKEDV